MSKGKKINIFVFHYKPEKVILTNPEYIHIWAGKKGSPEIDGFIGDDTGENISSKNKYYSELTGLYWVWKNADMDIVGSCHYRRFFTPKKEPFKYQFKRLLYFPIGQKKKRHGLIYTRKFNFWKSRIITTDEVSKLLEEFDAIMPTRRLLKYNVKEHYRRYHNLKDLTVIEKIIIADCPEYINSFNKLLAGNRLFANNMFILKKNDFQKLMEWLFSILFKFEEEIKLSDYAGYQERIMGFLSERLITLWMIHNELNYKELPLIYFKKLKQR